MAREETQDLISFCFEEFLPKLLTFSEVMVMVLLIMGGRIQGGNIVDRSLCLVAFRV
jgi:hypothetical protein